MGPQTHATTSDCGTGGDGIGAEVIAAGLEVLEHLGEPAATARLLEAIEVVTRAGIQTPDLGGRARTADVTRAAWEALG